MLVIDHCKELQVNILKTVLNISLSCLKLITSPPFICDLIQESTSLYHTRSHFSITETENESIAEEKNVMSIPKANLR